MFPVLTFFARKLVFRDLRPAKAYTGLVSAQYYKSQSTPVAIQFSPVAVEAWEDNCRLDKESYFLWV